MKWNLLPASILFCTLSFLVAFITPNLVSGAQELTDQAQVTATMPDVVAPSIPVLISPEDGSLLTTNKPTFTWHESTDNVAVSHYQLWIDGSIYLDSLSTTGNFNSYQLEYSDTGNYYSLSLKNTLEQAGHTWKIIAVDTSDNTSSSATWSFEIDSIAPSFVLTRVGDKELSISAQDTATIPSNPIKLTDNEPWLYATSEALSEVELSIVIPGANNIRLTHDVDSQGRWKYRLPILPRDKIITLNFLITDPAGHIVALEGVKIIIVSPEILLPKPSPTLSPAPTLKPGEPTLAPTQGPTQPPDEPPKEPLIKIPYLPPKEAIYEFARSVTPDYVQRVATIPAVRRVFDIIGPLLALIFLSLAPSLAITSLLLRFKSKATWGIVKQILIVLGLWPGKQAHQRQGLAFDRKHQLGVPLAEISFIQVNQKNYQLPIIKTTLTDLSGLYPALELPPGEYRATTNHPDYSFPTQAQRPTNLNIRDYYQGETVDSSGQLGLSLFIPLDNHNPHADHRPNQRHLSSKLRWEMWLVKISQQRHPIYFLLFSISAVATLFYPSIINLSVLLLGIIRQLRERLFKTDNLHGLVTDTQARPLAQVAIRAEDSTMPVKALVTTTNQDGQFAINLPPDAWSLEMMKLGYIMLGRFNHRSVLSAPLGRSSISLKMGENKKTLAALMRAI